MEAYTNMCCRYISLCFLILALLAASADAEEQGTVPLKVVGVDHESQAELVWVEQRGAQYDLYLSEYNNGTWQPGQLVARSKLLNVTPTIARDKDGHIRVVWSGRSGTTTDLYYSVWQNNVWSAPVKIETHLVSSLSPCLIVDQHNQLWLAWAGFDGEDDDIFFSRWNGADWDLPDRVNIDNVTPDLFPVFGIGPAGLPWIQWSGYENGGYKQLRSAWNGTSWGEPQEMTDRAVVLDGYTLEPVEAGNELQAAVAQEGKGGPSSIELPDFLTNPEQATFHVFGARKEMQALPLRDFFAE